MNAQHLDISLRRGWARKEQHIYYRGSSWPTAVHTSSAGMLIMATLVKLRVVTSWVAKAAMSKKGSVMIKFKESFRLPCPCKGSDVNWRDMTDINPTHHSGLG